ncbi:MAG: glycosyltransferase [Bacteroidia bacterium]|nr:glycosyltransferase [Bacteroidia bacterium]
MNVLYVSYDGMTDPLGRSQVMPYVTALARRGLNFTVLSAEKPELARERPQVAEAFRAAGVEWHFVEYSRRYPILSAVWNYRRLWRSALRLHVRKRFAVVHCRSYLPAAVGLRLKRRYGVKMIFDMRGFWADERVEAGLWDLSRPHFRVVYRYFKNLEKKAVLEADYIVALTEAAKREMIAWNLRLPLPVAVVPCCADENLFDYRRSFAVSKTDLGIPASAKVLVYLGSISTWYKLGEMVKFFHLLNQNDDWYFLVVTRENPEPIRALMSETVRHKLVALPASREEVPAYLSLADLSVAFIAPTYSKLASSPTKIAETMFMGVPIVANAGVGDVQEILSRTGAGVCVRNFSDDELRRAAATALNGDKAAIRHAAMQYFTLESGVQKYLEVYRALGFEG